MKRALLSFRTHKSLKKLLHVIFFMLFALVFLYENALHAQCFVSPGNPIAGSSNVGVLQQGTWRVMAMYKYDERADYFRGDKSIGPMLVETADYNFLSATLAYGISKKWTVEAEAGYFLNKSYRYQEYDPLTGSGPSNILLSAKTLIYSNIYRNTEWSVGAGLNIPFSREPRFVDGVMLPVDLQPSSGNYGVVGQSFLVREFPDRSFRILLINRYHLVMGENKFGYRFGSSFQNSIFLARHLYFPWTDITKDLTAILQLRHKYTGRNRKDGEVVTDSGSQKFFVAPQLNYNPHPLWNISLIAELPLYQYYNGVQISHNYSIAFIITRDIGHEWQ